MDKEKLGELMSSIKKTSRELADQTAAVSKILIVEGYEQGKAVVEKIKDRLDKRAAEKEASDKTADTTTTSSPSSKKPEDKTTETQGTTLDSESDKSDDWNNKNQKP